MFLAFQENRGVDLAPKDYIIIYGLIVTLIVISFLYRRRGAGPVKLNLQSGEQSETKRGAVSEPNIRAPTRARRPAAPASTAATSKSAAAKSRSNAAANTNTNADGDTDPGYREEKSLNVMFQWNGMSFDAFEVLGIPAGSSRASVQSAYQQLLTQGDPSQLLFFKAAYESILFSQTKKIR